MRPISLFLLGTFGLVTARAAPAGAAPAWCKGGDDKPSYDLKTLYSEPDVNRALSNLVAASCYPESDLANQDKQIAKLRDAWSKKLALIEDDWADVSEWVHSRIADPNFFVRDRKAAWTAYSPLDQYAFIHGEASSVDDEYVTDAFGAKLTQAGRLAYVGACKLDNPVEVALCAPDAAQLDLAKLAVEIRGDKTHPGTDRMEVRLAAYEIVTTKVPKLQAELKALAAKDAAYGTIAALAETAHKTWAPDAKLLALASELDDARITGSRKASAGCGPRAWDGFRAVVAAIPAKQLGDIHGVPGNTFPSQLLAKLANTPNGYLASLVLVECAKLEGDDDDLLDLIGFSLVKWPGFRGPRTASHTAILTAGIKLDDRDATLDFPDLDREWMRGTGNTGIAATGVIQKLEVQGEKTTITFKKEKITQQRCVKGHETTKISQILDGRVHYYYQCDQEITETIEVPPSPPRKVRTRYASALAVGMTVAVSENVAVVAYPKGKTDPVVVLGIEVK